MSEPLYFVTARLDEEEKAAWAVIAAGMSPDWFDRDSWVQDPGRLPFTLSSGQEGLLAGWQQVVGEHVARHDPLAVCRDVAWTRRLITLVTGPDFEHGLDPGGSLFRDPILCLLACRWIDHPGFEPGWRGRAGKGQPAGWD